MALPLHTKVKKAFRDFLAQAALAPLAGYTYVRGMRAGYATLPCVSVAVISRDPLFVSQEENAWKCRLDIGVWSKCDYNNAHQCEDAEDAHDAAVAAIEDLMFPDPVREYVNSENIVNRPVTDFHVGPFNRPKVESAYSGDRKAFLSILSFDLVVQNDDGDSA